MNCSGSHAGKQTHVPFVARLATSMYSAEQTAKSTETFSNARIDGSMRTGGSGAIICSLALTFCRLQKLHSGFLCRIASRAPIIQNVLKVRQGCDSLLPHGEATHADWL